jgi:drug/metabolite transporter (DMT)-like permease
VVAFFAWRGMTARRPETARRVQPAGTGTDARRRGLLLAMAGVGLTDAVAEICYAWASTRAALSVVAVLAGLYPVVTVALSLLLLRQRIRLVQGIGAAAALTGVLLFTASS